MKGEKSCVMCQKAKCSYKCPKCMSPYCSLGCWAIHKTACPVMASQKSTDNQPTVLVENQEPIEDRAQIAAARVRDGETVQAMAQSAEAINANDTQDVVILQPEEKKGIRKSKEIMSLLKSKRLRDDITCVDSSKDRSAALKAMRTKNPEFNHFVELLLDAVKTTKG